ncbi:MAG: hypothetical protein H7832_13025 [Magnetococcus sp. DMHC-6]
MATLDEIILPDDLLWEDEFSGWSAVVETHRYTADGNLEIEASALQAGRPITLTGGEQVAWVDRSTVLALYATTLDPERQMVLTLADARQFTVRWRHLQPPPLEAHPIIGVDIPLLSDPYQITLKLMEV